MASSSLTSSELRTDSDKIRYTVNVKSRNIGSDNICGEMKGTTLGSVVVFLFIGSVFSATALEEVVEETIVVECYECPDQYNFDVDLVDVSRCEEVLCLNKPVHTCDHQSCVQVNETNLRKSLIF